MSDDVARGKALVESGKHMPPPDDDESGFTEPRSASGQSASAASQPVEFPPPTEPLAVARRLYTGLRDADGIRTLLCWRGGWMLWRTTHWSEIDHAEVRSRIYRALENAVYWTETKRGRELKPWAPTRHRVANVAEAMAAVGHLFSEIDPPAFIEEDAHIAVENPAAQVISCRNGLLDLTSRQISAHTPALFNVVSVPFDHQADAQAPAWLAFLDSVWPDDVKSIMLLQEFFGYVLSGRTDMQKLLLLIGPTRSGKGTIARVLTALVGRGNSAGPTLASLGTNFGLSPLLGKPLAVVSDARLGSIGSHTVVERLLSITGEDMLTVDRKYREPWSGKLPTRFTILSNELPRFRDSSGAIACRLLILQMTQSFLGKEDRTLDAQLRAELPGILAWSLTGLDRLNTNGVFTVPASSDDAATMMMDLVSPVSAFVRDCCVRAPSESVAVDTLYDAWKAWADVNGHLPGAKSTFGRDFHAAVPEVKLSQPTVNSVRTRVYAGIGLQSYTYSAFDPVHPVQDRESAGQPVAGSNGQGASRARACTGCGARSSAENPLLNGLCTRCTGLAPPVGSTQYRRPNGYASANGTRSARQSDAASRAAYRNGLCVDCKDREHSAGRPRCEECHRAYLITVNGYT
ncbi:DNA primase family protein [Mycolicibacterium septicum]|uniref:DNA primase family protein n=1 Tax=Mycolicibacterium septicum TaxID=98668 RepID=UPI0023600ED7|nr:phage/plasmid primase, P4 family [Mycolicibacterium septicum]